MLANVHIGLIFFAKYLNFTLANKNTKGQEK
jgi:hypothetical protein